MVPLYINLMGFTIVQADIVRKYSIRIPEGAMVTGLGDPYTVSKFMGAIHSDR
jgi:hypothetical protein